MPPSTSPATPLARSMLLTMGARIAVVIALCTLFSYLHMLRTLRAEALLQLQQYVTERSTREQSIFQLAEDNHAFLKKALVERLGALAPEDTDARFERLFTRLPDGTVRNRPEGFDGTREVGLFVPPAVAMDAGLRRRILASYDVLTRHAPSLHVRFVDTFITLPEGVFIVYWPERPSYCQDASPTYSATTMEYFLTSVREHNPERRTAWSGVYREDISAKWMTSATTPVDDAQGRHIASISHDVLLEELMARTLNDHLPGAYNVLLRANGELIAHPGMDVSATARAPLSAEQQEGVHALYERVKAHPPGAGVLELQESGEYVALARLAGPGWFFTTVLPESVVAQPALQAARVVLVLGVLALFMELALVAWVLRRQITRPLLAFTQATDRIANGEFKLELDTGRDDELGLLARAFRLMADRLQRREEELRAVNEGLEQRVEARTHELQEVQQQLVQTARRTGMAEVATNVLHNVGNVLTSVYTSSQVAKERVMEMRLEHVGRVVLMLQQHASDLGTFLSQDERGRHLLPFLDKLGQNLVEERHAVISLLDDVGRYTEHVGEIIKVQQNYARTPRVHEPVLLQALVEDALRINAAGLARHQVVVEQRLAVLPPLLTDKHKALMILVNLVSNAKYAMDEVPRDARRLSIQLERASEDTVRIQLHDNGMGIAPEMLTRIFQYGFTTREEGHGFGLHSSALAAQELGGSLSVHSAGPGQGATFTLQLPFVPAPENP